MLLLEDIPATRQSVLIVDDDESYAHDFLAPHFAAHWSVQFAYSVPQALALLPSLPQLCLALVDLDLPGGAFDPPHPGGAGFTVVQAVRIALPTARVVVLTGHLEARLVNTAQRLGADYLVKQDCGENLMLLVGQLLLDGRLGTQVPLADVVAEYSRKQQLSPRQAEILSLAVADLSRIEIAERLSITAWTLKSHIRAIIKKCGASRLNEITQALRRQVRHS